MSEQAAPREERSGDLLGRRIARRFWPYRVHVACALGMLIVSGMLDIFPFVIVKPIVDNVIVRHERRMLIVYCALVIAVGIFSRILTVTKNSLNNFVGRSIMRDLRNQLYGHLQCVAFPFYARARAGEIQARFTDDLAGLQTFVTGTAAELSNNLVIILCTLTAMVYVSPLVAALWLLIAPFLMFNQKWTAKHIRPLASERQRGLAALSGFLSETLSVAGVLVTKHFGRQDLLREKCRGFTERIWLSERRLERAGALRMMILGSGVSVITALSYFAAGWQALAGKRILGAEMTAGAFVAMTGLLGRSLWPAIQLSTIQENAQAALALFERIFQYLDLPLTLVDSPNAVDLPRAGLRGRVEFRGVSFAYSSASLGRGEGSAADSAGEMEPGGVLSDISFAVEPGEVAALVGPSGAGKTTIAYLLARLYDVGAGTIQIDGRDIRDFRLRSLAETVGVVAQEPFLFNASVRENILFGRPGAAESEVIAAARAAAMHDRIAALPEGYDTVVGERGYHLSGGEKQRLVIARVILKNPGVLILDEATSALDTHSERLVQASLNRLVQGRTTLVIAHRLSTIQSANNILVLERGRIVERGSHAHLIAHGKVYPRLCQQQFVDAAKSAMAGSAAFGAGPG